MIETGIAIVGAGHWGPNLIRNFHNSERSRVTWIIDHDEARLKTVAAGFEGVRTSTSLEDALRDDATDAVAVATPTSTHFAIARSVLDSGRHALVEKPLTTSVADSLELCRLARERGVSLMVGHVFVYNAGVRDLQARLARNDIGSLHYVSMLRTNLGPIRSDVNAAWDLAAHDIAIANFLLGTTPICVSSTGGTWINDGIEDTVFATFTYPESVVVHVHASWLSPEKVRKVTAVGSKGMLTFDDMNLSEPVRVFDKGVTDDATGSVIDSFAAFRGAIREGNIVIPRIQTNEPLRSQCDAFLDSIEGRGSSEADGAAGLEVVRALEALSESLRCGGKPVDLQYE